MRVWIPLAALALALSPLAVLHPVQVVGHSMEPSLAPGQVRWVLRAWVAASPRRGEVWLVETPEGPALKRVVGLPGDRLEERLDGLWLNGRFYDEPWVSQPERTPRGPWAAEDGFLVLGDNRPQSRDSRTFGPLPTSALLGRVLIP